MLKYRTIDGKATPFLVCDACGKLIDDVYLAGVIYRKPQPGAAAGIGDVFFAHKDNCLDAVELKLGPAFFGWEELHRFLSFLTHNVKLTPQDISDTLELSRETGI